MLSSSEHMAQGEPQKSSCTCTCSGLLAHRQPKLNFREPLNYKDLYGNTTDLCKMVETNIVLSIKST